jgi:pimeloyl-ACP methyl ester carboxylesterase
VSAPQRSVAAPDPSAVRYPGPWRHIDVSANGVRFHAAEAGSGPLVLLLHGFGQLWWSWRHQLEHLPQLGYRAVAVDLRGYGDSDKPPRGYDAFTLAGDTSGLIRALGEPSAVVVGTGLGGLTAFNTAAIRPQQVRAVVAVNAAHPMSLARMRRPRRAGGYRRLLARARWPWWPERRLAAGNGAGLERIVRQGAGRAWLASADYDDAIGRMRDAVTIPGVSHAALEHLRWISRSPWRSDGLRHREALLRHPVTAPVLHIGGEGDRVIPLAMLSEAAQYCSGGYLRHVISGVGHYAAEESPARVTELMADFLQGLDQR